jgi:hypothetical protein
MKKIHILLCTYNLTPQKKSRRCFCSEVFSEGIEAKLYQGEYKDGQDHKLGDTHGMFLHQQKSQFAILQTFVF